jgi:hypothetical protein
MTAQTAQPNKPYERWIPDEAREHARAARNEIRKSLEALLPPEFIEHRHQARKEMLLAWRSMIDSALKRMDETEKKK